MLGVEKLMDVLRMKDPEEQSPRSVYKAVDSVPESVYRPSTENVIDFYRPSTDDRENHLTYYKPRINTGIQSLFSMRVVVSTFFLIGCIYVSMSEGQSIENMIGVWSAFFAVLVLCDPVDVVSRIAAPQTRFLISFLVALFILGAYKSDNILIIACILLVLIIPTIYFKNYDWLMLHNWLMTDSVEKAMRIDSDNRALKSWVYGGRKEAYTLLHELGFGYSNKNLDGYARPLYALGYWSGVKYGAKVEGLESDVKYWQSIAKQYEGQLLEIERMDSAAEDRINQLDYALEQQTEYTRQLESQYKELETAFNDIIEDYEAQIRAAAVEPVEPMGETESEFNAKRTRKEAENNIKIVQLVSDRRESLQRAAEKGSSIITDILESNLSLRKTAAALDVKLWKVEHVRKAYSLLESGSSIQDVKECTKLSLEEIEEIKRYIA